MKKRTFIIGVVWAFIFIVWWAHGYLYKNWQFNLFSPRSWRYIFSEFEAGWVISTPSDWFFIISLILIPPLFFLGWWLWLKIHWLKISAKASKKIVYGTRQKAAELSAKKFKPKQSIKTMRPKHMSSAGSLHSGKTMPSTKLPPPSMPGSSLQFDQGGTKAPPPSTPAFVEPPRKPAFLEDDDELKAPPLMMGEADMLEDETDTTPGEDIGEILKKTTYTVWQDVALANTRLNFICVDEKKIFIIAQDDEKGDWLADEEQFTDEPPMWFSESAHRTSPLFILNQVRRFLSEQIQRKGLDYSVQVCYCLGQVNVINWEEMKAVWKKLNVFVAQNRAESDVEIPLFSEIMPPAIGQASPQNLMVFKEIFLKDAVNGI